ncbi:MAG: energy-coupling factor ABC transporter ATP-binding protein [Actinomycetota bacterium]|nr:energy-coupling factor ABC transporter ATP-binding protein [Actinomycetota bacterium]
MTQAAIEVRGLRFAYPDGQEALRGVDLRVEQGQRVALLGPNGAGKTTLALHLNGIYSPAAGSIRVGELAVEDANLTEIRRRVGLVFQDPDDQLFMPTVRQDVAFGPVNLGLRGEELENRVTEALAAVGAGDVSDRAPHHLSGGERRRASLATVLAMRPHVLVCDEPTSGLDPAGRRELVEVLRSLPITQLLITHDLPFALELCDRAVIMSQGRVVADGATAEVLADEELLQAHRLELPYGFDPRVVDRSEGARSH